TPLIVPMLTAGLLVTIMLPGMAHNILTLQQRTYELNEAETLRIVNQIRANSGANDEIIAPPHLASIAKRKIAQENSEHSLWRRKYMNERLDNTEGRAVQTVKALAEQRDRKEIPYLVLDRNQTGAQPEIAKSVKENYRPLSES